MGKLRRRLLGLTGGTMRSLILILGLLSMVGITLILYPPSRPDFYQPARPSLTEAKRHLDFFYADEKLLLKELSETRQQLDLTLNLLSDAGNQLSRQQHRTLERLRVRLHQLENIHNTEHMTPEALQETYRQLAAELKALIEGLD
ncbi:MAG: hypothetical protein P8103_18510 [Candidatus Thiodiazotropha sp.]